MNLYAVVLNWNGLEDTLVCLESLRGVPTICVDNGSVDGTPEVVRARYPEVELIETGANLGFSGGNNVGISRALERGADWVALVNNDATVASDLRDVLSRAAEARPDAGVLAAKIFFAEPPDVLWYAGGDVNLGTGYFGRHDGYGRVDDGSFDELRDVGRAAGAAMAVSRAAIERVGMLDEALFAYVEDVEWCLRIHRAGLAIVFVPDAHAWHRVSASTGGEASPTAMYYDTRNTIVVCERYRHLSRGLKGARRAAIVGAHIAQALRRPGRRRSVAAVLNGWRDARRGVSGPLR